jgi:hypothetical protein
LERVTAKQDPGWGLDFPGSVEQAKTIPRYLRRVPALLSGQACAKVFCPNWNGF